MQKVWGHLLSNDPAYNPNLALDRADFSLAYPSRAPRPWLALP
jgi:O-antigen biosynthesis protein